MNIPILICLLIFNISFNYCTNILTIPFESKLCKSNEKEEFLSNYYEQFLYTQVTIGSDNQKLELSLKLNKYITYIIGSKISNLKSDFFNEKKSETYEEISTKVIEPNDEIFIKGIKSSDNFIFGENIKYDKYIFYLSQKQNFDETGQIGLKMIPLNVDKDFSGEGFVDQLKVKSLISSYNFYFKYEVKDENEFKYKGNLIIGGMPHEIEPSELFNYNNFVQTYAEINELNTRWVIKISSVSYGNEIITENDSAEFSTTFGFILAPVNFIPIFDKFFNNDNCNKEHNGEYLYLYCDKYVDITQFKDIFFRTSNKELNFTLTYKDLFRKIGDNYYFLILFNEDTNQWEFGHIFLKKYIMVFNGDKRTIGYYYQSGDNDKKSNIFTIYILIIISIIFGITIIGLLIYIFYFRPKNKRKIRPNELEENFDYTSSEIDKQINSKLGV